MPTIPRFLRLGRLLRCAAALALLGSAARSGADTPAARWAEALLRDPSAAEWRALARFDGTLTRREFERRLDQVFDPEHGLAPYLEIDSRGATVLASSRRPAVALARILWAGAGLLPAPDAFRSPAQFRRQAAPAAPPLAGLRIAIEPADIGGRWAAMEDRSVYFRGYGRLNEGDLNLRVALLLAADLRAAGASVFLVRSTAEPVVRLRPEDLREVAADVLARRPWLLPEAYDYHGRADGLSESQRLTVASGLLLTKTLETRARADRVRRNFSPDLTLVLQHDATPDSAEGKLCPINRNIFFVDGAYAPEELGQPEQRFRLLTKLLENVSPAEIQVADAISARFQARTGFPPVLYGNSATTRLVLPGNLYVVARNLAFNREHDGPVVVTEPYFMNQPETLLRLLAGDYSGERRVAGRLRPSIYREYADCVAAGIEAAYGRSR